MTLELLLANCVSPWIGMMMLGDKYRDKMGSSNNPPPKPSTPEIIEVIKEVRKRIASNVKKIPYYILNIINNMTHHQYKPRFI